VSPKTFLTEPLLSISFEKVFRSSDSESEQLSPPSGFAFTPEGHFILSDDFNHRIQIYDGDKLLGSFGEKGKGSGQFHYPKGIAVDADGNIYVADSWNHRVQKFDSQGNHQKTFGSCGEGKGGLNEPYDIIIENSGNILVVERYNHRLQWFSPEGKSLGWIGQRGTVLEQHLAYLYETSANLFSPPAFEFPTSIARDSQGNSFVADSGNHRVVKFDKNWKEVLSFGERGDKIGQFQYPLCVSVGENDFLYVSDLNNNRIQIFSPFGQFLSTLDQADSSTPLKAPCLAAVSPQGKLYVGLTFNSRIFQFCLPSESLESVSNDSIQSNPKNLKWQVLHGQLMKQSGKWPKVMEDYGKAIQLMWFEGREQSTKAFDADILLDLNRIVQKEKNHLKHEATLLKGLKVFSQQLRHSRQEVMEVYEEWEEVARTENDKEFKKQLEVLEDREDPRVFNQELFDLEKKDKILFRKIRALSYKHCRLSDQLGEYISNIISTQPSSTVIQEGCNNLIERLNALEKACSSQLAIKEKNELEMVKAFSNLQEDQSTWSIFLTNFLANNRIALILTPLLFELRTLIVTFKCSAQVLRESQEMGEFLTQIITQSPSNQIVPKILLGIQETRSIHTTIDTLWRDLIDTWITLWGKNKKTAARKLDLDYFSPLPFDIEDLNIEEVVRSYNIENARFEKTSNRLVMGNDIYNTDSLPDGFTQKVSQILKSQASYEEKNQELQEQLKDLQKQRRELNLQLKHVSPQDKRTPISIKNSASIVDFQVGLLRRMILTLEINENHNINRLITGSALAASSEKIAQEPLTKSFFEDLSVYHSQEESQVQSIAKNIKTFSFQFSDLKNQQLNLNLKQKIENVDRSVQLDEELDEIQNKLGNLEFDLIRHSRIRNRLDHLFDFLKQTGIFNKNRSVFDLVPVGPSLTRGGPAIGALTKPMGLTFDSEGNLVCVDQENHHVYLVTQTGIFITRFGGWGNGPGNFQYPVSVQVDGQGNIYVVDLNNQRVQKFSSNGKFLLEFGNHEKENERLGAVFSSSVDNDDNLWVADTSHQRIQVYRKDGSLIRSVRPKGLDQPIGICCLESGEYLVADKSNDLIKRYNSEGALLANLKREGAGFGDLYIMTFSPTYGIFASDHWSNRILHLDPALNIQGIYGGSGRRVGQFNRVGWMDVYKDLLAVADMTNHRIQIFNIKKTLSF